MISARRFTGSVLIGWLATFASIAIGLVMSPFLIHHLGETGYGVWVLIQSTVSYMYFMDLGLRTTVVRFTTEAQAQGNHRKVNEVISAALWVRFLTAVVIFAAGLTLAALLPRMFHIPTSYLSIARVALVLCASTLSSTLVFSVFSALLSGMGRFDLLGGVELAQVCLTSGGIFLLLHRGHSLIAMAAWQFAVVMGNNLLLVLASFRLYPQLRILFRRPDPEQLRALWSLGFYVLLNNAAAQLILYSDNLVVGAFVAAAAVSYYAVAAKMVEYLRQCAIVILRFFMPMATSFVARGQFDQTRRLYTRGTQAVLLITFPIAAVLFVRGGTFLRLWIGPHFSSEATPVLRILIVGAAMMLINSGANGLALALDEQRKLAWITVAEGLANLALSIVLVRKIGVVGVAIGTVVPTALTSIFFWPALICRRLDMSLLHYVLNAWGKPLLTVVPFAMVCSWLETHRSPISMFAFFGEISLTLPFYLAGVAAFFWKEVPLAVNALRQRSKPAPIAPEVEADAGTW